MSVVRHVANVTNVAVAAVVPVGAVQVAVTRQEEARLVEADLRMVAVLRPVVALRVEPHRQQQPAAPEVPVQLHPTQCSSQRRRAVRRSH